MEASVEVCREVREPWNEEIFQFKLPWKLPRAALSPTKFHELPRASTVFHVIPLTFHEFWDHVADYILTAIVFFHPIPNPYQRPLLGSCVLGRPYVAVLGTTQVALRAKNPPTALEAIFTNGGSRSGFRVERNLPLLPWKFHCFHGSFVLLLWKLLRASSQKIVYETSVEGKRCALAAFIVPTVRKVEHRVDRNKGRTVVNNPALGCWSALYMLHLRSLGPRSHKHGV